MAALARARLRAYICFIMGDRDRGDGWKRIQVERTLAQELHDTGEAVRLANLRIQEISGGPPTGAELPDSHVELRQCRAVLTRAQEAWKTATDRWVAFVKDGAIPEDLNLPEL